ncbi:MAG: LysR family transcriptional regulator [Ottowia sp.]|nr:LysR family transcriptional regulator [Ottowia sp.]
MDRLQAMQVFVATVEGGSLSAAADRLDMSRPVVTRHIAQLEAWTGARLLHRSTRRLSLTTAGEAVLPTCRQMLALAQDLQTQLQPADQAAQLSGQLRLTTSNSVGQMQLAPALAAFVARHPGVSVDLLMQDRAVNLVEERIDLAIRIATELDPNLIARRLCDCHSVICASPAYLATHGQPERPEALDTRNCLTHSYFGKSVWQFTDAQGGPLSVAVSGNLTANDAMALMRAAEAGAGIARLPTVLTGEALAAGTLVPLLTDWTPEVAGVFAVYNSRRNMLPALRALLDFLVERFAAEAAWGPHRRAVAGA